jgi:hypothetical protein
MPHIAWTEASNPRAIQQAMGHKSLETTMGYLHSETLSVPSPLDALPTVWLPPTMVLVSKTDPDAHSDEQPRSKNWARQSRIPELSPTLRQAGSDSRFVGPTVNGELEVNNTLPSFRLKTHHSEIEAEIKFTERTAGGLLRYAEFVKVRDVL